MTKRLMIIGLDCVPPKFLFERYRSVMPVVSALIDNGAFGAMRSTVPPITVPAWTSMVSGRDPGELGLYGFRNRKRRSYGWSVPTSSDVRVKRLWDWVSEAGKKSAALFVPLTFPATPLRGQMVAGMLTPDGSSDWAFPKSLKAELQEESLPFWADVHGFRDRSDNEVMTELFEMADAHFKTARYIWRSKEPDLMMMVEIGPDRLHHAFYHHLDPSDADHDASHPLVQEGFRYYAHLDRHIGELVGECDPETAVMIVSDHGARSMEGGILLNQWLINQGYLTLKQDPTEPSGLTPDMVDWSRTVAWGAGGYYGRVFINVRGREPSGTVEPGELQQTRQRLATELSEIRGEDNRSLETVVRVPEETFRESRGTPPDLMVFFDNLRLRSLGTVSSGRSADADADVFQSQNDQGRDRCNHDWDGVFVLAGATAKGPLEGVSIYDIPKTALSILGIEAPNDILGRDRSCG